jgi:hypothetical protein
MKPLHYEIENFVLPNIKFVNRQKSYLYSNSIEFDCLSENDEILFLRTPACKCVFFNGHTIILQIIKNGNLYLKFISFIKKIEQTQNVSESLIKENENQVLSMVIHIDMDAFIWFERERPVEKKMSYSTTKVKTSVVAIIYLDKKILNCNQNDLQEKLRWRCFQLRDIFLQKRKCMIRFKDENEDDNESIINFDDIFFYKESSNISNLQLINKTLTFLPPPPPPPLPPVFKMNNEIVIKKKQLVDKLKKETSNLFVVSQDELNTILKKFKKE